MERLRTIIAASARRWHLSPRAAEWIFWIAPIGGLAMILARFDKDLYRFLLADDGPVEWMQFFCFLMAGVAAAAVCVMRTRRHLGQGVLYGIFALGMLFVAGEEIAWGQRIIGLSTPPALEQINTQGELTLHNIENVLGVINLVMMSIGLLGGAAYLLNRYLRVERFGKDADFLFVPPPFLASSFLFVFFYKLIRLTVWQQPGFTITKYGEWSEFCLALALFLFATLNYRRLAWFPDRSPVVKESTGTLATEAVESSLATASRKTPGLGNVEGVESPS